MGGYGGRPWVPLSLALLLALLAYRAAVLGWASMDQLAGGALARQFLQSPRAPAALLRDDAEIMLASSRALAPLSADYALARGVWLEQWARQESGDPNAARRLWARAEADYRAAVRLRPAWARAWSRLAVAGYLAHGVDAGVSAAMRAALECGPWEPEVLGPMAWLSMRAWEQLPTGLLIPAWQGMERAVQVESISGDLLSWAATLGWSGQLAPLLDAGQRRRLEALGRVTSRARPR